jgi:hypothetical protein
MSRGMDGFDENGDVPLELGTVSGVRYFKLNAFTDPCPLRGQYGPWAPGGNEAECLALTRHDGKSFPGGKGVPHPGWKDNCGCGFWGYWDKAATPHGNWDVLATIEGWGAVLRGPRGFRASKAKLTGFTVTARVGHSPWQSEGGAEAWLVWVENELEKHYGVRVYASEAYLLHDHPPSRQYKPDPSPPTGYHAGGWTGVAPPGQATWAGSAGGVQFGSGGMSVYHAMGGGGGGGGGSFSFPAGQITAGLTELQRQIGILSDLMQRQVISSREAADLVLKLIEEYRQNNP